MWLTSPPLAASLARASSRVLRMYSLKLCSKQQSAGQSRQGRARGRQRQQQRQQQRPSSRVQPSHNAGHRLAGRCSTRTHLGIQERQQAVNPQHNHIADVLRLGVVPLVAASVSHNTVGERLDHQRQMHQAVD